MKEFFKKFKEKHTPISVLLWCVAAFALFGCVVCLLMLLFDSVIPKDDSAMSLFIWFIILLVSGFLATVIDKLSSISNSLKKQNEEKNN